MKNKKIKIFMYIYSLHTGGGAENVLFQVSAYLHRNGLEVIVCGMLDEEPSFEEQFGQLGIKVIRLSANDCSIFTIISRLVSVLKKEKPDIMVNWLFPCILTGGIAGKLAGVPKIIGNLRGPDLRKKWFKVFADRIISNFYTGYIAVSRNVAEIFRKREKYPQNKITIIENGIKLPRKLKKVKHSGFVIGSVGRLYPEKNQALLLQAIPLARKEIKNLKVILVGDGPERQNLEELARKLGIFDIVEFVGWQNDVYKYLLKMDVFVLPSHYEGHSGAILQAWGCGLPVVATKVTGIRDLVVDGRDGLLFSKDQPQELANILINLNRMSGLAKKLGEQGRKNVKERYTFGKMLDNYKNYFTKII